MYAETYYKVREDYFKWSEMDCSHLYQEYVGLYALYKPTAKYVHSEDTYVSADYFQWSEHDCSHLLGISKDT